MRNKMLILLLPVAAFILGGCSEGFLNEEMQLGTQNKVRPLGIFCEPPEASPGDTVTVTLAYHDPNPDNTAVYWRVALDFDSGLYESDPVERHYVDLDALLAIEDPVDTGEGFMTQSFQYVLPDSILLWTTAIPMDLDGSLIGMLAEALGIDAAENLTKDDVDAFFAVLTPEDLALLDPKDRDLILDLADIFACQIRFRATLNANLVLDITRNLTVRHSRRLGSPNVNENAALTAYELVVVSHADIEHDDLARYSSEVRRYPLLNAEGDPVELTVPCNSGWTYYLETTVDPQQYTSPFSGDQLFTESEYFRWYSYRRDSGDATYPLFRDEEGEEIEDCEDDWARIVPPAGDESRFAVSVVVRDVRGEWEGYHGTPGATLRTAEIVFLREDAEN